MNYSQSLSFTIDFTIHVGKDQVDAVANEIAQIQAGRKTKVEKEPLPVK